MQTHILTLRMPSKFGGTVQNIVHVQYICSPYIVTQVPLTLRLIELCQNWPKSIFSPLFNCPQAHVDLKITKEHHKFIIGREGQKLKTIELQTATKVSVPRHDDASDIIRIVGTREGVDKARHQIQMVSDEQVCVCVCVCVYFQLFLLALPTICVCVLPAVYIGSSHHLCVCTSSCFYWLFPPFVCVYFQLFLLALPTICCMIKKQNRRQLGSVLPQCPL